MFKFLDGYGIQAQLFPALIAFLPCLGLLVVVVPWDRIGIPHAVVVSMSSVLVFAGADWARRLGRRIEQKIGTRSTPELFYRSNNTLSEPLKRRYREFLAKQIGIDVPTEEDERMRKVEADQFYNSASAWLREKTRDTKKFNILFKELIVYGFRRNLLGLKPISLAANIGVSLFSAFVIFVGWPDLSTVANIRAKLMAVESIVIIHTLYIVFIVSKSAVTEASLTYGRQLILSCENLMSSSLAGAHGNGRRKSPVAKK